MTLQDVKQQADDMMVQPYHQTPDDFERDEQGNELVLVGTDAVMQEIESGILPLYIQKLDALEIPVEEKEPLLSLYKGVTPRSLKGYSNRTMEIQGAMLDWHPAYKGKPDSKGVSEIKPGYYKLLLLTTQEDENGNLVVLSSSSSGLIMHMAAAMKMYGWYIWDKPVRYNITIGENGSHHMVNVDRPSKIKRTKK